MTTTTTTTASPVYGPFQTIAPIHHDHDPRPIRDTFAPTGGGRPDDPAALDPFGEWRSPGSRWDDERGYVPGEATEWTDPVEREGEHVTWCRACGYVPGHDEGTRRERARWAACDHEDLTDHRVPTGADVGRTTLDHGWTDRDAVRVDTFTEWTTDEKGKRHRETVTVTHRGEHVVRRHKVTPRTHVPGWLATRMSPDYAATTVARQAITSGRWVTRSRAARADRGAVRVGHVDPGTTGTTFGRTFTVPAVTLTATTTTGRAVPVAPAFDGRRPWAAWHGPASWWVAPVAEGTGTHDDPRRLPTVDYTTTAHRATIAPVTVTVAPDVDPAAIRWDETLRTSTGAVDKRRTGGRQGGKGKRNRRSARVPATPQGRTLDPDALARARAAAEALGLA